MSRVISGSGREQNSEYMSGMRSRANSMTSSKPALVNSASGAPLRWMMVLIPTVVPCTKRVIRVGSKPSRSASRVRPVISSAPGSSGVVSTFSEATRPEFASSAQKSMNVPPISTPTFQSALLPAPFAIMAPSMMHPFLSATKKLARADGHGPRWMRGKDISSAYALT